MRKFLAVATLLAFSGSLGVAALFAGSAPSFARARNYPTGPEPDAVAVGDLNGDGKLDLATVNGNAVSVLLNSGGGSFLAKRDYQAASAYSVAIGDLNGDGKPDLVTANGHPANTVSVLFNLGDGGFQAKLDYPTGSFTRSVAVGDLNEDGKLDLATANYGADTVSVLVNTGDGTFQARRDFATGDGPDSVAISDLNQDGKLDVVTANDGDSVSVLLSSGDGSFQDKRDYRTGPAPDSLATGDLNGDGKLDLVTANIGDAANTVSVLLNRGDGSFQDKRDYRTGGTDWVAVGDLNGDRKPDLATANGNNDDTASVLANRGDGSFQSNLDYRTAAGGAQSLAIGDLNGDGRLDLATANEDSGTVSVLLNTPGLCTVQDVSRQTLPAAKRKLARANCRVGKIHRAYSKRVKKGRVISQKPKFGAVQPGRSKVNLVISRGRKR